MDPETKRKVIIGISIGLGIVAAIFIKNKLDEQNFKPMSREEVISILKKGRKENYSVLKLVSSMASQIAMQMQTTQVDPQMIRAYLEGPESPLNVQESFEKNFIQICTQRNVKYSDFNDSVDYYIRKEDKEIQHIVDESQKDFNVSLSGRMPQIKVSVPEDLTKERLIQVQRKLTLKKYLIQVEMFRRLRGKSQQELMSNPELMKNLPNSEQEEEKILEEEGFGNNEDPASAVFAAGVMKFRNDPGFKEEILKIENDYKKIFARYAVKMQQNKMTDDDINELEDELIYMQPQRF